MGKIQKGQSIIYIKEFEWQKNLQLNTIGKGNKKYE